MQQIEHFIATLGFPIALVCGLLLGGWYALRTIFRTLGPNCKEWLESQIKLTDCIQEQSEKQTEILGELNAHATHGHRALRHALDGVDELAGGRPDQVKNHLDKARDALLD